LRAIRETTTLRQKRSPSTSASRQQPEPTTHAHFSPLTPSSRLLVDRASDGGSPHEAVGLLAAQAACGAISTMRSALRAAEMRSSRAPAPRAGLRVVPQPCGTVLAWRHRRRSSGSTRFWTLAGRRLPIPR
jgi:hypothetical protein